MVPCGGRRWRGAGRYRALRFCALLLFMLCGVPLAEPLHWLTFPHWPSLPCSGHWGAVHCGAWGVEPRGYASIRSAHT